MSGVVGGGRLSVCLFAAVVAILVGVLPSHVQAQPRKSPASESFSNCREQEKLGDAKACWTLWLTKFRATGSEAETAYAEEHGTKPPSSPTPPPAEGAQPAPGATKASTLHLKVTPAANVELDGHSIGEVTNRDIQVKPGEHKVVITAGGMTESRVVTFAPGQEQTIELKLGPPPESPPTAAAPSPGTPATPTGTSGGDSAAPASGASTGYATGDVMDFCSMDSSEGKEDKTKFQRARVVVFAPAGAEAVNDDAQIRAIDGARLIREVFSARFPLQRFHNVVTSLPSKKGWEAASELSLEDIRKFLQQPRDEGDRKRNSRSAREREFVSYSLACTDYVALPTITSHEVQKQNQQAGGTSSRPGNAPNRGSAPKHAGKFAAPVAAPGSRSGGGTAPLSLKLSAALGIFKRDGTTFKRVGRIEASVPGIADLASDAAGVAVASAPDPKVGGISVMSAVMAVPDLPSYVSAVPDPECLAGKAAKEGVKALLSCGPKGEGTADQALGNLDERLGPLCREAAKSGDPQKMIQCEVRARAFQLARALQKQARGVEGWRLFGILAMKDDNASIALGRDEGVSVGYAFEAVDENGDRIAFFKVTSAGVGGDEGETDRTELSVRSGDAVDGAKVQEYPQVGLVLAAHPSVGTLFLNDSSTKFTFSGQTVLRTQPTLVFGGGGTLGYDLSSPLHWTETYLRIGGGVLYGSYPESTQVLLVPVDVWFEKGFYLARRVTFTMAIGGTYQYTSTTVTALPPFFSQDLHFTGNLFGPGARLGFSFMLHPDWSLNLEAVGRFPVNAESYGKVDDNGNAVPSFWQSRSDHFASFVGNMGLAWTY